MTQSYRVTWEIDADAGTPREAAQKAFEAMQRQGTTATYFEVFDEAGEKHAVDLLLDTVTQEVIL